MEQRLITLEVFGSEIEAELARERLEVSGIEAHISKDDAGGARPDLQLARGVRLLVFEEDTAAAREILGQPKTGTWKWARQKPPWTCARCGETIEDQFTECWQCGSSRPLFNRK